MDGGLEFKDWAVVVNAVGNIAIGAWLYLDRKADRTNTRIDDIGRRVGVLDDHLSEKAELHSSRIAHLEGRVEKSPTHADMGKVYDKVSAISNEQSSQGGRLEGMDTTLRMILARITEKGMR